MPWKAILTSSCVHANMIQEFAYQFVHAELVNFTPVLLLALFSNLCYTLKAYFRDVLHLELERNGIYNVLPLLVQFFSTITISITADWIKRRYGFSDTRVCKTIQTFGKFDSSCHTSIPIFTATFGCAATLMSLALFVDCTQPTLALALMITLNFTFSGQTSGW